MFLFSLLKIKFFKDNKIYLTYVDKINLQRQKFSTSAHKNKFFKQNYLRYDIIIQSLFQKKVRKKLLHLIQISILITDQIIEHFEILDTILLVSSFTFEAHKSTCKKDRQLHSSHSQPKSTNIKAHLFSMPLLLFCLGTSSMT